MIKNLVLLAVLLVAVSAQIIRLEEDATTCGQGPSNIPGMWEEGSADMACAVDNCMNHVCPHPLVGCVASGPVCDDNLGCSQDQCDPATGTCTFITTNVAPCNSPPNAQHTNVFPPTGINLTVQTGVQDAETPGPLIVSIVSAAAGNPTVVGEEIMVNSETDNLIWYSVTDGTYTSYGSVYIGQSQGENVSNDDINLTSSPLGAFSEMLPFTGAPALTFTVTNNGAETVTTTDPNVLDYINNSGAAGDETFDYNLTDGVGNMSTGSLIVHTLNHPPAGAVETVTTNELTAITVPLAVSDENADTLTITIVSVLTRGTATVAGTDLTYTPSITGVAGMDVIMYEVSDGVFTETGELTVNVIVNSPPAPVVDLSATVDFGTQATFNLALTDPDGDAFTVVLGTAPTAGTAMVSNTLITYDAAAGNYGDFEFTYIVDDTISGAVEATVTVTVNNIFDSAPMETVTMACSCVGPRSFTLPLPPTNAMDVDGVTNVATFPSGFGLDVSDIAKGSLIANTDILYDLVGNVPDLSNGFTDTFTYFVDDTLGATGEFVVEVAFDPCTADPTFADKLIPVNDPITTYPTPRDFSATRQVIFQGNSFSVPAWVAGNAVQDVMMGNNGQVLHGSFGQLYQMNTMEPLLLNPRTPGMGREDFAVQFFNTDWTAAGITLTSAQIGEDGMAASLPNAVTAQIDFSDGGGSYTVIVEWNMGDGSTCLFFPSPFYPATSGVSIGITDFNGTFFPALDGASVPYDGTSTAAIPQNYSFCFGCA